MITTSTARKIASDWHGGQMSRLYSFASTGTIRDKESLLTEIRDCQPYANISERKQLALLTKYVLWS